MGNLYTDVVDLFWPSFSWYPSYWGGGKVPGWPTCQFSPDAACPGSRHWLQTARTGVLVWSQVSSLLLCVCGYAFRDGETDTDRFQSL